MMSPSWTRPTPNGTKSLPVGPANGAPGGKPWVVHDTRVPRRGNNNSVISPPLQRGHHCCTGNVVAPQLPHRLPISCGLSSGQVEISGASAFCIEGSSVVRGRIIRSLKGTTFFFQAEDGIRAYKVTGVRRVLFR